MVLLKLVENKSTNHVRDSIMYIGSFQPPIKKLEETQDCQ